jgi:two-component system, OmpR family, response regulator MprA
MNSPFGTPFDSGGQKTRGGSVRVTALVVDDEQAVRLSIKRALELEHYEVECVATGRDALDRLSTKGIDVVILDVNMAELDGLATCRMIRSRGDTVPVLMLTARNRMIDTVVGLDCGADDYLAKPFDLDVLYARLRSLLRRASGTVAGVVEINGVRIDTRARTVELGEVGVQLTPREFDLVELLVRHAGVVLRRDWIVEQLWGAHTEMTSNSLDVFVANIRRKTRRGSEAPLIQTVRGIGYTIETRWPQP